MRPIFVFVKCDLKRTYQVAQNIVDSIEQTAEIFSVSGEWDLLCRFNLETEQDIGRFVTDVLQAIPGIRDTSTMLAFRLFTPSDPLK